MALNRRHKADNDAGGKPRGVEARATTQPKEGRMAGKKKGEGDDDLDGFLARIERNPHHAELMRQKITLKTTGVDLPLQDVTALLVRLRDMQERKPDQFGTLVAIVKPRGAICPAGEVSPKAMAALKKHGVLSPNGSPERRIAAILDAAYVETKEGVVLRDPIIYPTRQFVNELTRLKIDLTRRIGRAIREEDEDEDEGRNPPDTNCGPSR